MRAQGDVALLSCSNLAVSTISTRLKHKLVWPNRFSYRPYPHYPYTYSERFRRPEAQSMIDIIMAKVNLSR